jgi:phytoene dehydrogenase-like protein
LPPDVAVVGAGHNALTAAAVLASEGLEVVVAERLDRPGGALSGNCAYAVHLLHEDVVALLGLDVRMRPLPPRVAVLPDGSAVRDGELEPDAYSRWGEFWEEQARAFEAGQELDERSVRDVLHATFASQEARCVYASRYLDCDFDEPGGVAAHAWMETGRLRDPRYQGRPEGGMQALADAFAAAAIRAGAELRLGCEVVGMEPGAIVLAGGERVEARVVVSGADPVRTFRLLGRDLEVRLAPAAAKLELRLREPPQLPGDGLVHVYPELDWYERRWPDHPEHAIVELQPDGATLSAYLHVAAFGRRDELTALLLEGARRVVPDLDDLLVDSVLYAPEELEARLGLTGGQIHHLPHAPGVERPGPDLGDGVFLCGAGTRPGGEISGLPGLNAARAVLDALS